MREQPFEWSKDVSRLAVSDLIRWTDAIWPERKRRRKKTKVFPHGEQRVTAQLLELDSREYVRLQVIKAEIVKNDHGLPLKTFKKDEIIVKKRATIQRGSPERLVWLYECDRSREISEFLT